MMGSFHIYNLLSLGFKNSKSSNSIVLFKTTNKEKGIERQKILSVDCFIWNLKETNKRDNLY
jgi:hypothetical protein